MSAEILINVRPSQTRVAYVEDGVLAELKIDRKVFPTLVGSVYKGRVLRVLPGMQAAFVDIGLDRAAFLYVGDIKPEGPAGGSEDLTEQEVGIEVGLTEPPLERNIVDLVRAGEDILVQVAKDPLGTKGARITTQVALPGRHVVYMPEVQHVGISRRISSEAERARLRRLVEKIRPAGGVILRTAATEASEDSLRTDIEYLQRVWGDVQKTYEKRKNPGLIYSDLDIELRALRDLLNERVDRVLVDNVKSHKKIQGFLANFMPGFKDKVQLFDKPQPLFDLHDIELEIARALDRKIWLKSGGYVVFDEAEALVAVDVNTGSFVGKKDFEETILKANLEAAKEIAHQLRIRNCGGIIVIDFIDMQKPAHREQVLVALREHLAGDQARTDVISMTGLGLVEMTRKRNRPSLNSILCEPCQYCTGRGYLKSKMTVAQEIFRSLEREPRVAGRSATTVVHCHAEVADWIYEEDNASLELAEERLGHPIALKVEPQFHTEEFEIHTFAK
jgi:ribonuclease G